MGEVEPTVKPCRCARRHRGRRALYSQTTIPSCTHCLLRSLLSVSRALLLLLLAPCKRLARQAFPAADRENSE